MTNTVVEGGDEKETTAKTNPKETVVRVGRYYKLASYAGRCGWRGVPYEIGVHKLVSKREPRACSGVAR